MSNDVIPSRIIVISFNILKHVIGELAASPFAFIMQLDGATDISQCSQLLVFVRYVHVNTIKEELLFCESLLETTKTVEVLEMVNNFFCEKKNFGWKGKLHTLCRDGALAMPGNTFGFAA
jgi:hypothetical protein